jgi:hypothetical protein
MSEMQINQKDEIVLQEVGYGENCKKVDTKAPKCFAKQVGEKYYVRRNVGLGHGNFYNVNEKDELFDKYVKVERYPFKEVTKKQFDFYLLFLERRSVSYLRLAERG